MSSGFDGEIWLKGSKPVNCYHHPVCFPLSTLNLILTFMCVVYISVRPKRYLLGDLVDWIYAVMRKDRKWGYMRYDMRFDPLFLAKTWFTQNISPGWPVGLLHFEGLELVRVLIVKMLHVYCIILV